MDRGVKVLAAMGVLTGGIIVAIMFRHESPPRRPATPRQDGPLLLRKEAGAMPIAPMTAGEHPGETHPALTDTASKSSRPATVVAPMDFAEPPRLPRGYPGSGVHGTPRRGTQENMMPAARRGTDVPRTHKIVDGDTLEILAERYLGSTDRYRELYEANRDILPSPQLLPIGVELKIPPQGIKKSPSPNMMPKRRLVPLRPE